MATLAPADLLISFAMCRLLYKGRRKTNFFITFTGRFAIPS